MLFSVFNALGPISIPTPHADTVTSIHPLPVSWYLISSVCMYRCSCMQITSILCSTADAVNSDSWPILFRVLTLNVAICIVCLHFSSFCLSSVADFSNTEARALTSAGRALVYVCGLSTSHGYLSMAVFILIYRSHSYRWAAVVPRLNWQSWALSRWTHTYIMLLPMCTWGKKKTKQKKNAFFTLSFNLVKVQDCCMFRFKEILGYISSYHPIPALIGFYFIGRIRFMTSVAFFFFFFFFFFFLLLWGCAIKLLSFRKSSICPVY